VIFVCEFSDVVQDELNRVLLYADRRSLVCDNEKTPLISKVKIFYFIYLFISHSITIAHS